MNKKTNTIIRMVQSTGIFFIGNALSKLIIFFMLPIYTKYIPAEDFGYYDLSITYITLAASILFFDIWVSTMRYMYDKASVEWKSKVILSGASIFAISMVLYIVLYVALEIATDIQYLAYIFLYGISLNIHNMYTFLARGYGKNVEYAISGIINTLIMISVNIILIVGFNYDFSSLYIAGIVGNMAQSLFLEKEIRLLCNIKWKLHDKLLVKQMFIYTMPLCINSVAYWLLTSYNKLVINDILSTSYNGIYAIGNKFAYAVLLFASCFTFAWQDVSFSKGVGSGEFYSKASRLYLIFLGAGTILLIPAFNVIFPFFVDKSYSLAKDIIPLFLITTVISSYSTFIGNIFYAIKDTKTIFVSMVAACILNLILCRAFITIWGLNGANLSIAVSFLLNILIRYFILRKKIRFSFEMKSSAMLLIGIFASMLIYEKCTAWINLTWLMVCGLCLLFIFRNDVKEVYSKMRINSLFEKPPN